MKSLRIAVSDAFSGEWESASLGLDLHTSGAVVLDEKEMRDLEADRMAKLPSSCFRRRSAPCPNT